MKKETRKPTQLNEDEPLIVVARAVRTRGLKGEIVADLLTDFPDRFDNLETVTGIGPDDVHRSLQIEEHWFHGNRIIFKFIDYDSIDTARDLAGYQLAVPAGERIELDADQFYEWELAGCRVEGIDGNLIGTVREVMRTGGVGILVVANDAGREFLVPMARDICIEIDVEKKLIRVDPPEGLLEL